MRGKEVVLLMLFFLTIAPIVAAYDLCEDSVSTDKLEIIEIIDTSQIKETAWEWAPTESVNIEVSVKNKNFTTRNFNVELFFLDEDLAKKNITTNIATLKKTISLEKSKEEILNFSFQLNEPSQDTYYIYAKLYDSSNESICTSLKAISKNEESNITIKEEEKIIVIKNVTGPENITKRLSTEYTVEAINLGNKKEEKVSIVMYNANLGIRETREIENLEVEKSQTVTFNLTIPENATTNQEYLLFSAEYDYSEKMSGYYQSSEKSKRFLIQILENENPIIDSNKTSSKAFNQTSNQTKTEESILVKTPIPYLWPIIITTFLIMAITAITLFFLKHKKTQQFKSSSISSQTQANTYVKSIQSQT